MFAPGGRRKTARSRVNFYARKCVRKLHLHGVLECAAAISRLRLGRCGPRKENRELCYPAGRQARRGRISLCLAQQKTQINENFARERSNHPCCKSTVRQHLPDVAHVRVMHALQLLQPPQMIGALRSREMALPGMAAQDFAVLCDLESLGGAAMRLDL
jgi:hypothetical protein